MDVEIAVKPAVTVIGPSDKLEGFIFGFWAKFVNGFNPMEHCQACLYGPREKRIGLEMTTNKEIALKERQVATNPYFYICGVTSRWRNNFHLAMEWAKGEEARGVTFNGFEISVTDAREIPIPPLPDGFAGLPKSFTTCRNFQFAVDRFGLPEDYVPPKPKPKKKSGKSSKAKEGKTLNLEPGQREMLLAAFVEKDGDIYLVPSDSSDLIHEVTLHGKGRCSCTCVHGRHRPYSANCYHVKAAIAHDKGMILKPLL
jgi:hypothetical protein